MTSVFHKSVFLIFISLVLFLSACVERPSAFYVATDGNDSSRGTIDKPFASFSKAISKVLPDETIYVRAGTYHEQLLINVSGEEGFPITIAAYQEEEVIIDGTNLTAANDWRGLIDINGQSDIILEGFSVQNSLWRGIFVIESKRIVVRSNKVNNAAYDGIVVWTSSDIEIDDNEVTGSVNSGIRLSEHDDTPMINVRITGNLVYNNDECGIWIHTGGDDAVVQQAMSGIIVDGNISRTNGIDGIRISAIKDGSTTDISVGNNVIQGSGRSGLLIYDDPETTALGSIDIVNNTFYNNGTDDIWGSGGIFLNAASLADVMVINNIVSANHLFSISISDEVDGAEVTVDYNLITDFMNNTAYFETRGTNYVEADPLFTDTTAGDFTLQTGSPAIDAGFSVGAPETDFNGTARPQGAGVDIGAFEYSE